MQGAIIQGENSAVGDLVRSDEKRGSASLEIRLASNHEDMAMVMAIRAAVFLGEEDNITYADEFNGNDFCASHLIALVNGDPAGVIRCRWFADFALLERVGVRKRYRSFRLLYNLAKAAHHLCWQKGYRLTAGRARGDSAKFWRHFGSYQSGPEITIERGTLTPMVQNLDFGADEPGMRGHLPFGNPYFEELIVQPEGQWDFDLLWRAQSSSWTGRGVAVAAE
jgi:hypothetical protein